jgi:hypothetical protein
MMKRLLDEQDLQADDEQLADLLRSAAPFEVDPFRKRRILVRVERGPAAPYRGWRFWLRPAAAVVLLISGSAAAAIGHHFAAPGTGFFGLSVARSATATRPERAPSAPRPAATAPESAEQNHVTPDPTPSAALGSAVAPNAALASATRSPARARPESAQDASNVVEAIQALRGGRDPARAQSLLDDYLKTHPHGALSGDALALSIEAASARNDPSAADYARRYLAAFPKGKYRDLANRALEKH